MCIECRLEGILYGGFSGEIWIQPGKEATQVLQSQPIMPHICPSSWVVITPDCHNCHNLSSQLTISLPGPLRGIYIHCSLYKSGLEDHNCQSLLGQVNMQSGRTLMLYS